MAVKISLPKALETKIRSLLQSGPAMEHCGPIIRQLVSLMDDAYDKRTKKAEQQGGLHPRDVIQAVRGILGTKISVPPNPGAAFYGFMKKRTKFLNVSLEDIERAAVFVRTGNSKECRLPNSLEWFIRKLDVIINEADSYEAPETGDEWTIVTGR